MQRIASAKPPLQISSAEGDRIRICLTLSTFCVRSVCQFYGTSIFSPHDHSYLSTFHYTGLHGKHNIYIYFVLFVRRQRYRDSISIRIVAVNSKNDISILQDENKKTYDTPHLYILISLHFRKMGSII